MANATTTIIEITATEKDITILANGEDVTDRAAWLMALSYGKLLDLVRNQIEQDPQSAQRWTAYLAQVADQIGTCPEMKGVQSEVDVVLRRGKFRRSREDFVIPPHVIQAAVALRNRVTPLDA